MFKWIKNKIENRKLVWAFGVVAKHGLSVVKIVTKGGKQYFVANDGSLRLIK